MNKAKEYAMCIGGALLVAVGVYFFKFPNNFSTGGVSGLSIILGNYFHLSTASVITTVINAILLVLGFLLAGSECGLKNVIGTATMSGALLVFERLIPLSGPLTDQPLLELIYAILLPAVGSAILFNCDGSTGGTDIVALILRKYTSMNIGAALLVSDVGITALSFLFGPKVGLFSVLGLIMKTLMVDSAIESINLCKCFSIITEHPQEISDYITHTLKRGCTILEATGGYSHQKKFVMLAALSRYQAVHLQRYLRANYPTTFMMITNSSEVLGKGFRGL